MYIVLYTKTTCPYCDLAKTYLSERSISYTEEVYDDDDARQTMYNELGLRDRQRMVPQIFLHDEAGVTRIGGYSDLLTWGDRLAVGNFNEEF